MSVERTKKGNKDGMTALRQSSIPWEAPCNAVCPSRISTNMAQDATIP